VPREHPLSRSRTIAIAALRGQPMITLTRGTGLRATLEGACRDAGFAPRIIAETSQLGHMVELVAAGLGVAVMPGSALAGAELAVLRITRPRLLRRTALAWNQVTTTPAGRAFLALAEARLRLDDGE
jgi:DNA-binding transcriptional LysR family regulator